MLILASNLGAARSQMAFTLGFHIILASLGVAFPALMLIANYRGLRRNDPDALRLAEPWSKAPAVTFAVGAVTGPVISFEFGLPWPVVPGRFGGAFGVLGGRRDRADRLGLLIPFTVAAIATPIQFAVGDTAARAIANDQPVKFAAMECNQTTHRDVTEYIFGICTADGVKAGVPTP